MPIRNGTPSMRLALYSTYHLRLGRSVATAVKRLLHIILRKEHCAPAYKPAGLQSVLNVERYLYGSVKNLDFLVNLVFRRIRQGIPL